MKNIYRHFQTIMNHSVYVLITRKNGYYNITNGFIGARIPESLYHDDKLFKNRELFPVLEENQNHAHVDSDNPYYRPDKGTDVSDAFMKMYESACGKEIVITDYMKADHYPENRIMRICQSEHGITLINEDYYKAFNWITDWCSKGDGISPLYGENAYGDAIILPIRNTDDKLTLDSIKALTGIEFVTTKAV